VSLIIESEIIRLLSLFIYLGNLISYFLNLIKYFKLKFILSYSGLKLNRKISIFPPVVFVKFWNCLSQQLNFGSFSSFEDILPFSGRNETRVQVSTWFTRFKTAMTHGIYGRDFLIRHSLTANVL
jgi:hypothetical protein